MQDWSDLRFFLALLREGSALAAARALGTDGTTVSRRVARLERRLGLRLFERTPRGAEPTPAAHGLRAEAEAMEAAATALEARAETLRRRPTGTIRLTMPPGTPRHLAALLQAFGARHPGIRFDLDDTDAIRHLERGEADIAIRAATRLEGDDLIARRLLDHPWAVYASDGFVARHGAPRDAAAAARLPAVTYVRTVEDHMAFVADYQARLGADAPRIGVATIGGMAGMVADGAGTGLLPRSSGDGVPGLRLLFAEPAMVQRFWLVWSREAAATPHVAAFLAFLSANVDRELAAMPKEWLA